jgi:dihydropteroate synthase
MLRLGRQTKLMGVLNVTPDSFSDGGRYVRPETAERRALVMQKEGAHLLDVGGESSRPGARPVSAREEIRRVRPVLKRLSAKIQIPISIDTYKYDVAAAALDEGAVLVNDICALGADKRLAKLIAKRGAGVILMHMRGNPRTMQIKPAYKDVCTDVLMFLKKAVDRALSAGIPRDRILIDPGFGFGKTAEQNLRLLEGLERFAGMKLPVLVGLSRKSFIGHALGSAPPEDRLHGSLAAASAAVLKGAHVLRVHDVLAHRQAATLLDGLTGRAA